MAELVTRELAQRRADGDYSAAFAGADAPALAHTVVALYDRVDELEDALATITAAHGRSIAAETRLRDQLTGGAVG